MKLVFAKKIWDRAPHSAFTDLIFFRNTLYCAFRESNRHVGKSGAVRVLCSVEGEQWRPCSLLWKESVDLRDPKLSLMPDGRLLMLIGGSRYQQGKYIGTNTFSSFSEDGEHWSDPLETLEGWAWGACWKGNIAYCAAYRPTIGPQGEEDRELSLVTTSNGVDFTTLTLLPVPDFPSETVLRFLPDDKLVAIARRKGNGWIGLATPPYKNWYWQELNIRLGGPNLVILNNTLWLGTRLYGRQEEGKIVAAGNRTAIGHLAQGSFFPDIILPSTGDTGYPGMVYNTNERVLYVSYYSSDENRKTCIFFAKIRLS